MNKLWKYNEYDEAIGGVPLGKEYKQKYYFQSDSPGSDYSEVDDHDELTAYHKGQYPQRRTDALDFADTMHARISSNIIEGKTAAEMEVINSEISMTFRETSLVLTSHGSWKDAQREVNKVVPNVYVSQDLIDEIKGVIDTYVAAHY